MIPAVQIYLDVLRARRADILQTLDGLDAAALNWHPLDAETNSLYALATHALGAERKWIHEIVGGRTIERDRDAELRAQGKLIRNRCARCTHRRRARAKKFSCGSRSRIWRRPARRCVTDSNRFNGACCASSNITMSIWGKWR